MRALQANRGWLAIFFAAFLVANFAASCEPSYAAGVKGSVLSVDLWDEKANSWYTIGTASSLEGGYVLTAAHVVADAHEIGNRWAFHTIAGELAYATIVAYDDQVDLAILKYETPGSVVPAVLFCGVSPVGTEITVYGYPLQLGLVVTRGDIVREDNGRLGEWGPYGIPMPWPHFYLSDASAAPGNSGGPAFAGGLQVGVLVGGAADSAYGFMYSVLVPSIEACKMLDSLK